MRALRRFFGKSFSKETGKDISEKDRLLNFLDELKALESRLWGVRMNSLNNNEERVLEDANHLIHLLSKGREKEIRAILRGKEVSEFFEDVKSVKQELLMIKKLAKDQDLLRDLISDATIRLVSKRNYPLLEEIFLLEKQLYEVLDRQEEGLAILLNDISSLTYSSGEEKVKLFLDYLLRLRNILAGHMDHHGLWEEERLGFSNSSNIVRALEKRIRESIE